MFVSALLVVAGLAGHAQIARPNISCVLSNGDRITGEFVSISRTRLTMVHAALGRLRLRRTAVAVCETADSTARRKLGTLALMPLPEELAQTVTVGPDTMPRVPAPAAIPAAVSLAKWTNPPQPVPLASRALPTYVAHVGWKRSLGMTYMLSRGNANVSSLGFTGAVARRADRSQIALKAKREFGSQEGESTENFLSATLRYDLALGPNDSAAAARPSFFTEAVFEHDPFAKIARRAVENTGLSVPLSRNEHNNIALEVGTGITSEAPTGAKAYTRFGGLLRLAARQIFGEAKSDQQLAIFPDLSGTHGHYRINGDINLSAPIAKSLALKLGISNRYDTHPQADVRKNDITVQSGIGIEF
jgi:putative salt-induced outer membrane protein YdiY